MAKEGDCRSDLLASLLGLLLLVFVVLGTGRTSERTLEDLEDFFIFDLLVGLVLGKVGLGGTGKFGNTVLGDGCIKLVYQVQLNLHRWAYRWWSTDGTPEHYPSHQQAHTASEHHHGHTQPRQPWRPSHHQAVAN